MKNVSSVRGKCPLVNVWQLAVFPVPVSTRKEPVLRVSVGVLPLLKPPESTAETHDTTHEADQADGRNSNKSEKSEEGRSGMLHHRLVGKSAWELANL